jgi:beta-galactosidase
MQNSQPDLHLIGHWSYPTNTVKTVYVAANHCDSVELFLNGKSLGATNRAFDFVDTFAGKSTDHGDTGYIYAFPGVTFAPGIIKAVGTAGGKTVAQDQIETAGAPKRIKLTAHTGPRGLQADGADVALIDVEVVDTEGRRCPTDEARVDFQVNGPAIWRGGVNTGKLHSINNLYLDTECGINRVAIRSKLQPGTITVQATREGLEPGSIEIPSAPVTVTAGLVAAP